MGHVSTDNPLGLDGEALETFLAAKEKNETAEQKEFDAAHQRYLNAQDVIESSGLDPETVMEPEEKVRERDYAFLHGIQPWWVRLRRWLSWTRCDLCKRLIGPDESVHYTTFWHKADKVCDACHDQADRDGWK